MIPDNLTNVHPDINKCWRKLTGRDGGVSTDKQVLKLIDKIARLIIRTNSKKIDFHYDCIQQWVYQKVALIKLKHV